MNYKLFKDKNFFLLMQGGFVSQVGTSMQNFALSLYVLTYYESATLFASILILSTVPRLILGPFAGVLVDWFDRKKIIVGFDFLSGVTISMMAILYYSLGELPLWSIYTVSIILSLISTLFQPAISTMIPTIMKKDDLVDANAIKNVYQTIASLISPLLAGFLMSFSVIGVILIINAISFFISSFSEMLIELSTERKMPEKINLRVFKSDFIDGINFIKNTKFILMFAIVACATNFAIGPVLSIALPFILKQVLVVKDYEFGILNGFVAISFIIGGIITPKISKKYSTRSIIIVDFIAQPIIVVIFTWITSGIVLSFFGNYMPILIMIGLFQFILYLIMTVGGIVMSSTAQRLIPNEMLGRVFTVIDTFALGSIPIGQGIYGYLLEHYEPWVPLSISAILLIVMIFKIYDVVKNDDYLENQENFA